MNRRNFVISAIGAAAALTAQLNRRVFAQEQAASKQKFKLKYAPHSECSQISPEATLLTS